MDKVISILRDELLIAEHDLAFAKQHDLELVKGYEDSISQFQEAIKILSNEPKTISNDEQSQKICCASCYYDNIGIHTCINCKGYSNWLRKSGDCDR